MGYQEDVAAFEYEQAQRLGLNTSARTSQEIALLSDINRKQKQIEALQAAPKKKDQGWLDTIGRGLVGGVEDSVNDVMGVAHAVVGGDEKLKPKLDIVGDANTDGEKVIRDIVSFMLPFSKATKLVKWGAKGLGVLQSGSKMANFAQGSIAGAMTDMVINTDDERLSNGLKSLPIPIAQPIAEYLAFNKDDSQLQRSLKNAGEGLIVGGIAEPIVRTLGKVVKSIRDRRSATQATKDPIEATEELLKEVHGTNGTTLNGSVPAGRELMVVDQPAYSKWSPDIAHEKTSRELYERMAAEKTAAARAEAEHLAERRAYFYQNSDEIATHKTAPEIAGELAEGTQKTIDTLDRIAKSVGKEAPEVITEAKGSGMKVRVEPKAPEGSIVKSYGDTEPVTLAEKFKEALRNRFDTEGLSSLKLKEIESDGAKKTLEILGKDKKPIGKVVYEETGDVLGIHNIEISKELQRKGFGTNVIDRLIQKTGKSKITDLKPIMEEADGLAHVERYGFLDKYAESRGGSHLEEGIFQIDNKRVNSTLDTLGDFKITNGRAAAASVSGVAGFGATDAMAGDGEEGSSLSSAAVGATVLLGGLFGGRAALRLMKDNLKKIAVSADRNEAIAAQKVDRFREISAMKKDLENALQRPDIAPELKTKIEHHLKEVLPTLEKELKGIKSEADLVKTVYKDPRMKDVQLKAFEKPVKVNAGEEAAFQKACLEGDIASQAKALSIDHETLTSTTEVASVLDHIEKLMPNTLHNAKGGVVADKTYAEQVRKYLPEGLADAFERKQFTPEQSELLGLNKAMDAAQKVSLELPAMLRRAQAVGVLSESLDTSLMKRLNQLDLDNIGAKDLLALQQQIATTAHVSAMAAGLRGEIARAQRFSGHLREVKDVAAVRPDLLDQVLNETAPRSKQIEALKMLKSLPSREAREKFARDIGSNPALEFATEFYYAALLSAPKTWMANIVGNSFLTFGTIAEHGAAALGNELFRGGKIDGVTVGEVAEMAHGLLNSFGDAIRIAKQSWKENAAVFDSATKLEGKNYTRYLSSEYMNLHPEAKVTQMADKLGARELLGRAMDWMNIGGRVLQSTDEFFKVINHRMALHQNAYRDALKEVTDMGLVQGTPEYAKALGDKVSKYTLNADKMRWERAMEFAREQTYTNTLDPKKDWVSALGSGALAMTAKSPALAFIIPFVRTPANIASVALEHTPILNLTSAKVRQQLLHGSPAEREMVISKMAFGGMTFALAWELANAGIITSSIDAKGSGRQTSGNQEYSVKVGDMQYSFKLSTGVQN